MEKLNSKAVTLGAAFLFLLCNLAISHQAFWGTIESRGLELQNRARLLAETRNLLQQREPIEAQWKAQESLFQTQSHPEEVLNQWVKALLEFAQKESVVIQKIEPQGKDKIFLLLEADIQKILRFLYALYEKDPVSQIEFLSLRADEDSKKLVLQLTLTKAILS